MCVDDVIRHIWRHPVPLAPPTIQFFFAHQIHFQFFWPIRFTLVRRLFIPKFTTIPCLKQNNSVVFDHSKHCQLSKQRENFSIQFLESVHSRGKYSLSEREGASVSFITAKQIQFSPRRLWRVLLDRMSKIPRHYVRSGICRTQRSLYLKHNLPCNIANVFRK